jgi:hypothetical protein
MPRAVGRSLPVATIVRDVRRDGRGRRGGHGTGDDVAAVGGDHLVIDLYLERTGEPDEDSVVGESLSVVSVPGRGELAVHGASGQRDVVQRPVEPAVATPDERRRPDDLKSERAATTRGRPDGVRLVLAKRRTVAGVTICPPAGPTRPATTSGRRLSRVSIRGLACAPASVSCVDNRDFAELACSAGNSSHISHVGLSASGNTCCLTQPLVCSAGRRPTGPVRVPQPSGRWRPCGSPPGSCG